MELAILIFAVIGMVVVVGFGVVGLCEAVDAFNKWMDWKDDGNKNHNKNHNKN